MDFGCNVYVSEFCLSFEMAYNFSNVSNSVFKRCAFQISTVPHLSFYFSTLFLACSFFLPFCLRGSVDYLSLY